VLIKLKLNLIIIKSDNDDLRKGKKGRFFLYFS